MTRWLIIWCVFVVGLVGIAGESYADCKHEKKYGTKFYLIHLRHCSTLELCRLNKGPEYRNEAKRRGVSCKAVLAKANILNSSFKRLDVSKRKKIQLVLSVDGYYKSSIDGLYGKGTAAALKAYNKEYLGNADLTKSDNISALFDDLLKDKPAVVAAKKCQGSDTKSVKCRPITIIPRDEQAAATEQVEATEPEVLPPLDFAKVKASYDAGNFSQAFEDAQTLSFEGNPDAQLYLGKMYADGRGTLQVTTSAHMWFNIASMNGSDEAFEERKTIQSQMTPELINEAQKMAVTCIKSDYKDCGVLVQSSEAKVIKEREPHQKTFQPTSSELRGYFVSQSTLQRKQIQYALKKLGYYRSSVDGLWGKGTKRAVEGYLDADRSINSLVGIYASLTAQVAVPNSFVAPQKTISSTSSSTTPSSSSSQKSYYKGMRPILSNPSTSAEQAWAICEPQAKLARSQARNSYRSSNKSFNCNFIGQSAFCDSGVSGGAWSGINKAYQRSRAGNKAESAVMSSCLAQYGWKE